jgi:hypothetical protein
MRPDLAARFERKVGKSCAEFFGTFEYVHAKSGRLVQDDIFPFHSLAFQEGLIHAENIGGDIDKVLNKRCIVGAFPWRYEGLEASPCRILCIEDAGEHVEAVGDALIRFSLPDLSAPSFGGGASLSAVRRNGSLSRAELGSLPMARADRIVNGASRRRPHSRPRPRPEAQRPSGLGILTNYHLGDRRFACCRHQIVRVSRQRSPRSS